MKKIAFITHSYHKKTHSVNIYAEEMFNKKNYLVDYFYIEDWTLNACGLNHDIEGYDVVVILQTISLEILRKVKCENIVFMPMYDFSCDWDTFKWLECFNLKILCMTKALHNKLTEIGLNSFYAKYYPEPLDYLPGDPKKIFLWQRINDINITTTLKLLSNFPIDSVHIHKAVDPYHRFIEPSSKIVKEYNIKFSEWFEKKQEYTDILKDVGIYIAPRLMEGGAAAFIDAMRMGKVVIANNAAAMNEYITHNETGLLYDAANVQPIDFSSIDFNRIQKNAYESVKAGRLAWRRSIPEILNFFESKKNVVLQTRTLNAIHESREHLNKELVNLSKKIQKVEMELMNSRWHHFGKLTLEGKIRKILKVTLKKIMFFRRVLGSEC